ncbi:MAG: hypothetical protein H0A75_05455 [Candidatus Methanofishera endochildressiae]|uniref:Uncharacterized protein n=1 Tax=Candidatus Methanofishera endochildressiae TaxID=2738884 RepID=A0A7Z0MP19_9GAMM|nr:hypothetical protein [Candidatus Methanofishera endochildressiae]
MLEARKDVEIHAHVGKYKCTTHILPLHFNSRKTVSPTRAVGGYFFHKATT